MNPLGLGEIPTIALLHPGTYVVRLRISSIPNPSLERNASCFAGLFLLSLRWRSADCLA